MKKWLRNATVGFLLLSILLSGSLSVAEETTQDTGRIPKVSEPLGADTVEPAAAIPDEDFTLVAGDNKLELYLNKAEGEIAVRDLTGEVLWHSTPTDKKEEKLAKGVFKMSLYSLLTLTVIDSESNSTTASTLTSYTECVLSDEGVAYEYVDNGFCVTLRFVDYGITVPLTITVEEGALCAAVDTAKIEETTQTWIRSLSLLPYFGAGNSAAEGYMLVPDGSGALIRFNNGKTAAAFYDAELYGADLSKVSSVNKLVTQQSYLPVFGLQNNSNGFLAVIDGATANATVHAEVAGKRTSYNAVSAAFTLRDSSVVSIGDNQVTDYEEKIKEIGTLSVRYYFYSNGGGYSEMASLYRQYLETHHGLKAGTTSPAAYIQVLNSYPETKSFLGFDYLEQKALTTYDGTAALIKKLQESGVSDLSAVLKNWDSGSTKESITKKPQFASVLGGRSDYNDLSAFGEEQQIPLYLSTRITAYRSNGWFSNFWDAARTIENVNIRRYEYSLSTSREDTESRPQYLLSPTRVQGKVETLAKSFGKKGLNRITVDDLATLTYADYTRSATITKSQSVTYFTKALAGLKEQGMSMISEGANAYALPYLDAVLGAPTTHSGYDIEDEAVPFYQLVLNGVMDYTTPALNLSSDVKGMFLWALESGSRPLYMLAENEGAALEGSYSRYYSIDSANWIDTVAAQYAGFRAIWDKTDGMAIASHELVAEGVALVIYENGARLLVNRTNVEAATPHGVVEARDYVFMEGE